MFKWVALGTLVLGVVLIITGFIAYMNFVNKEINIRVRYEAQNKIMEVYYDKLWKTLKTKAQVTDEYKKSFKDIYTGLISGRYDKDNSLLFKSIQESNPNFDNSMYKDLMAEVSIQREGFFNEQKVLVDMKREHDMHRKSFPWRYFTDIEELKLKLITSEITAQVFETGHEDNVDLFDRK